jgi:hypothetical protein
MKAIETEYNGYRFRSRLEARWAVFFDALEIGYEYEPEGYDLGGLYYLPDFWLPDREYWIEVKGRELEPGSDDWYKVTRLASASKKEVYVTVGDVWPPYDGERDIKKWIGEHPANGNESKPITDEDWADIWSMSETFPEVGNYHRPYRPFGGIASHHWWFECPKCNQYSLVCFGHPPCDVCGAGYDEIGELQFSNTPNLWAAYSKARGARFEHGETPTNGPVLFGAFHQSKPLDEDGDDPTLDYWGGP